MKKKTILYVYLVVVILLFSGCYDNKLTSESKSIADAIEELEAKDNSIDVLSMLTNVLVVPDEEDEGVGLTIEHLYKEGLCIYSYKDYRDNTSLNYEEIKLYNQGGDCESFRATKDGAGTYCAGVDPSTGGYYKFRVKWPEGDYDGCKYSIDKFDKDKILKETIYLQGLDSYNNVVAYTCLVDKSGLIHVAQSYSDDAKRYYYIYSSEGIILFKYDLEGYFPLKLKIGYDGRVFCTAFKPDERNADSVKYSLLLYDETECRIDVVAEYTDTVGEKQFNLNFENINLYKDNQYVYADRNGIYLYNSKFEKENTLYEWSMHGQSVSKVYDILMDEDEKVYALVQSEDGPRYYVFEPTVEEREPLIVEFCVSAYGKDKYATAVNEFNRNHPSVIIKMKDDYDETTLLTKIIGGDGPVIVDTSLVNFLELKNYWEPLDSVYQELGITQTLNNAAISLGTIDGIMYGIVTDFAIETLACPFSNQDLNYETFITKTEKTDGNVAVIAEKDRLLLATYIFDHGPNDSYFITETSKGRIVEVEKLQRLIEYIDSIKSINSEDITKDYYLSGEVLIKPMYIKRPEELIYYKEVYKEKAKLYGYPGKENAVCYLYTPSMLAVSKNTDKKEKEVALAFVKMLLSYEFQSKMATSGRFALSVRTDVLEEQIYAVNKDTEITGPDGIKIKIGINPDNLQNKNELYELMQRAIPYPYDYYADYTSVIREEFLEYYDGVISKDMLIDRIRSRIGVYLQEKD